MEAVIFTGIQATGKSSFYLERFFRTHVRINLDLLRTRRRERLLLEACLHMQQRFVVDNTNPSAADRARYIGPARQAGFRIIGYFFRSHLGEALARNARRPPRQCIPAPGLRGTFGRLEIPRIEEGFDELCYVQLAPGPGEGFVVTPWREP